MPRKSAPEPTTPRELYVSPAGRDTWTGTLPEPNARRTDGPLATLKAAQRRVRQLTREGLDRPVRVWVRGGTYFLSSPLVFGADDGGR